MVLQPDGSECGSVAARTGGTTPVYAFEPEPSLYSMLESNARHCGFGNVQVFPFALGASAGTAKLYHLGSRSTLCPTEAELGAPISEASVIRFSDFARERQLSNLLVKVDVENAEPLFIEGAAEEFGRIRYLVLEVLAPAIRAGLVNEVKRRFGLEAYYINDYSLEWSPTGAFRCTPPQLNWLFCRLAPEALAQRLRGTRLRVTAGS